MLDVFSFSIVIHLLLKTVLLDFFNILCFLYIVLRERERDRERERERERKKERKKERELHHLI